MTRRLLTLVAAGAVAQSGCVGLRPVGPMAELFPPAKPVAKKTADGVKVEAAKDGVMAALPPAPPPPAPTLLVSPAEVSDATADAMAQKLAQELEADRKAAEAMVRYAEVSVVGKK